MASRPPSAPSTFDWYRGDWEKNGQLVLKWVNRYSATKIDDKTKLSYLDYTWSLNKQQG